MCLNGHAEKKTTTHTNKKNKEHDDDNRLDYKWTTNTANTSINYEAESHTIPYNFVSFWTTIGRNAYSTLQLPVKSAEGTVDNNASQQWFPMFKLEDNNSKHKSRLGRPSTKDNEVMSQAAEENTSTSIRACQHSSALLKTLSFGICPSSDAAANV